MKHIIFFVATFTVLIAHPESIPHQQICALTVPIDNVCEHIIVYYNKLKIAVPIFNATTVDELIESIVKTTNHTMQKDNSLRLFAISSVLHNIKSPPLCGGTVIERRFGYNTKKFLIQ